MPYRPRDICSAAFFEDLQRLRLLAWRDAPGGLEYRFDLDKFIAAHKAAVAAGDANEDYEEAAASEDEEELEFDESIEAAIEADTELARLRRLYTLEEEEIDEDEMAAAHEEEEERAAREEEAGGRNITTNNTDGSRRVSDSDGAALYNPAVIEADMAAQDSDFGRFKRLLRHSARERAVSAWLQKPGLLVSGDSAAELATHGVMFAARECRAAAAGVTNGDADANQNSSGTAAADGGGLPSQLAVRWLPARDSVFPASPLHWAVLGRAHGAIVFLVQSGVDAAAEIAYPVDKSAANGSNTTATTPVGAFTFPPGLTAERLAVVNESHETAARLRAAVAVRSAFLRSFENAKVQVEGSLERRKARQEKRRLGRDQRRTAREERQAAAAEAEENEEAEDGDYDDDGNDGNDGNDDDGGEEYDD